LKPTEHAEHADGGNPVAADMSRRKLGLEMVRRVTAAATCFSKSPQITRNTQNTLCSGSGRRLPAAATGSESVATDGVGGSKQGPPRSRGGYESQMAGNW